MTNNNLLKLDDDTKNVIMEISALSGIPQNVVKEVLEYLLCSWAIKIADHPESYASLTIPYLGTVSVKYVEDKVLPNGEISPEVDCFADLATNFRKLVGDIYYEKDVCLVPMLQRKIEQAIMVASSSME